MASPEGQPVFSGRLVGRRDLGLISRCGVHAGLRVALRLTPLTAPKSPRGVCPEEFDLRSQCSVLLTSIDYVLPKGVTIAAEVVALPTGRIKLGDRMAEFSLNATVFGIQAMCFRCPFLQVALEASDAGVTANQVLECPLSRRFCDPEVGFEGDDTLPTRHFLGPRPIPFGAQGLVLLFQLPGPLLVERRFDRLPVGVLGGHDEATTGIAGSRHVPTLLQLEFSAVLRRPGNGFQA